MAIYPISSPPLKPNSEGLSLYFKQGAAQSPFSGHTNAINNYCQWQVELTFPGVMRGSTSERAMAAWLASLHGIEGSFLYYPADSGKSIVGKMLANTGFSESRFINVTGWLGTQATGLEAGDLFSLGNNLYRIVSAPANSTSGQITIEFEPALRNEVGTGTVVNFVTPRVEVRIANGDDPQGFSKDPEFTYFKPLACVQVL